MSTSDSGREPGIKFVGERPTLEAPDLPKNPYEYIMEIDVESLEKMHKVARHRKFEVHIDEPEHLRGDDAYPQPLVYVGVGIGS